MKVTPKSPPQKSQTLSARQRRKADRAKRRTEVDRYAMKTSDAAGGINLGPQDASNSQGSAVQTPK